MITSCFEEQLMMSPAMQINTPRECEFCKMHVAGETIATMALWDDKRRTPLRYYDGIRYCPMCGMKLRERT